MITPKRKEEKSEHLWRRSGLIRQGEEKKQIQKSQWMSDNMNIIIQRMMPKHEKKNCKKTSNKSASKLKNNMSVKHEGECYQLPLFKLNQTILPSNSIQLKYQKTNPKIDKNKIMTELRLTCSQKQYMSRLYSNPIAILKLRSNTESRNTGRSGLGLYINTQYKIDEILQAYRKGKINIVGKTNKLSHFNGIMKTQTKILSTGYDDNSQLCLKTLVTKIENMIQTQYNFSTNNILDSMKTCEPKDEYEVLFDESHCKISQINHPKVEIHNETIQLDRQHMKKSVKSTNKKNNKMGQTQPVVMIKPAIINEYGMVKYPQKNSHIKMRRTFIKKKNQQYSLSIKKCSKSASQSSKKCSSIHKSKNKDKMNKKKQEPYTQKKTKKKQTNKLKSPK